MKGERTITFHKQTSHSHVFVVFKGQLVNYGSSITSQLWQQHHLQAGHEQEASDHHYQHTLEWFGEGKTRGKEHQPSPGRHPGRESGPDEWLPATSSFWTGSATGTQGRPNQ